MLTNNTSGFGQTGSFDRFRVLSSTPANGQFYEQTTTVITIRMSEDVDLATVVGNVSLVETVGGVETNITLTSASIVPNGPVITISSLSLKSNADCKYECIPTLPAQPAMPCCRVNLLILYIDFSTGNGGTWPKCDRSSKVTN